MWSEPTFQAYYQQIDSTIREMLDKEDPKYLLQVDSEAFLESLVDKAAWAPLLWDESEKTIEPFTVKRQRTDRLLQRTYQVDEQRLRLRVPISTHPQLRDYFRYGPRLLGQPRLSLTGSLKRES